MTVTRAFFINDLSSINMGVGKLMGNLVYPGVGAQILRENCPFAKSKAAKLLILQRASRRGSRI
jgi:hypothetical protein